MKKKIQSYALNEQNVLVYAKNVDKSRKEKYICLNCKEEMIYRENKKEFR